MEPKVTIEGGFAEVGAGAWLMGRGQPAAFFGSAVRRRRKGFLVRDRQSLDLVETSSAAKCADARRPFLTHIPCAAPIHAVSSKVLVAPASARAGAQSMKVIPMSMRSVLCVTEFGREWVVMATASRTVRLQVEDGDTLSVRPESVVAWTGSRPTGFCPKLGVWDILLPRGPRDLLLHFYGPSVVWAEGAGVESRKLKVGGRCYGA
ncbi:MAG: hypothetical protein IKF72_01755 [Kiritimatiellae bacterium]|nr:hypothetical protein [Kiritimatiellia bacterium]